MRFLAVLLFALLILFFGCVGPGAAGAGEAGVADPDLPDWTSAPPADPGYCYGIGCDAELERARQKAIVSAGQAFCTEVTSTLATRSTAAGESLDSVVVGINRQLTDQRLIGAKFVDQYRDSNGEYWVLSRAPIDCVLDVAEGVLLSYRLEPEGAEIAAAAAIMEEIEASIAKRASDYSRGGREVYGAARSVAIRNAGFESPSLNTFANGGLRQRVDDWETGSTWFGRFRWPNGVPEGERAVWSSMWIDGGNTSLGKNPDNGFFQVLEDAFRPGEYTLSVWTTGDNYSGLTSRLSIGYEGGNNLFVPMAYDDTRIIFEPNQSKTPDPEDWQEQRLTVKIGEESPAAGRPIGIRVSSLTDGTGTGGGNSCWWDDVRLEFRPLLMKLPGPEGRERETVHVAEGAIEVDGDDSDWGAVSVYYQDEVGDARTAGTDLHYIKSAMDDTRAYFLFVCADEAWASELTLEINFDYAPGKLAHASHRGDETDLHTNIRERDAAFWQSSDYRGTSHDPGVRLRRTGRVIEFSVPLKRYAADYFAIVYANIWRSGDRDASDLSDIEM